MSDIRIFERLKCPKEWYIGKEEERGKKNQKCFACYHKEKIVWSSWNFLKHLNNNYSSEFLKGIPLTT